MGLKGIEPLDGGVVALTCAALQDRRPVVLKLTPAATPTTPSWPARATPWPWVAGLEALQQQGEAVVALVE